MNDFKSIHMQVKVFFKKKQKTLRTVHLETVFTVTLTAVYICLSNKPFSVYTAF
jgi:hypothetical protein